MLTFFLSRQGLESATQEELAALLEREGLVRFRPEGRRSVAAKAHIDPSGNDMWSLNVAAGVDERTFLAESFPMQPYQRDTTTARRRFWRKRRRNLRPLPTSQRCRLFF